MSPLRSRRFRAATTGALGRDVSGITAFVANLGFGLGAIPRDVTFLVAVVANARAEATGSAAAAA